MDNPLRQFDLVKECVYCGYSLRGHDGDDKICPECGQPNRLTDVQRVLLLLKNGIPAFGAPNAPGLLFGVALLTLLLVTAGQLWQLVPSVATMAITAVAMLWVVALVIYVQSYGEVPGAWTYLLELHFVVVVIPSCGPVAVVTLFAMFISGADQLLVFVIALVSTALVVASALAYKDMGRRLTALSTWRGSTSAEGGDEPVDPHPHS